MNAYPPNQPESSRGQVTLVVALMRPVRWISLLALLTTMAMLAAACSSRTSFPSVLDDPSGLYHAADLGSATKPHTEDSVVVGRGPLGTAGSSIAAPIRSPAAVVTLADGATCPELGSSLALVGQARLTAACGGVDNDVLRERTAATPSETVSTTNARTAATAFARIAPRFATYGAPSTGRPPPSPIRRGRLRERTRILVLGRT